MLFLEDLKKILTKGLLGVVRLYQWILSPFMMSLGVQCRYHPTCSQYAFEALKIHGLGKGLWLGLKRFGRCHPWTNNGGYDPVIAENCKKFKS